MKTIVEYIGEESVQSNLYVDPDIFTQEMEQIFCRGWVYVAHESELPHRGDYVRRSMGLEPVVVSRTADGIRVVANRCAHRGNLLCQAEQGNRKVFACQYHGWVFSQAGDLIDVPLAQGACADRQHLGLKKARVESYRGFVFATFADEGPDLVEHLGHAASALDRMADLSPLGQVSISGPWIKHLFRANWKMLSENEADGYHVGFVHDSFAKAIDMQGKYSNVLSGEEDKITAVVRYLGNGHTELDYGPTYEQPLAWLGVQAQRYPEYMAAMQAAYGDERAHEIMRAGPPHTFIFPNLFLAETCLVMIQPVSVGETVNMHVPMRLAGVPQALNQRILRQGEVAMGPSAFLTADDAIIAERQWRALSGSPAWLDLSRGKAREFRQDDGVLVSHYTDETPNRGFWRHYRSIMSFT